MTQLQREVEELQSVSKVTSDLSLRSRSKEELREQSPYDQNGSLMKEGRRVSPRDESRHATPQDQQRPIESRLESPYASSQVEQQIPGESRRSSDESRGGPTIYESRQMYQQRNDGSRQSSDETYESRLISPEEGFSSHSSRHISPHGSIHSSPAHGSRLMSPAEQQTYISPEEERQVYSPTQQQQRSPLYEQQVLEGRRHSPTDGADFRSPAGSVGSRASDGRVRSPEQSHVQSPAESGARLTEPARVSPDQIGVQDGRGNSPKPGRKQTLGYGDSYAYQEDSGHHSFEPHHHGGRTPFGSEGQSLSPRLLRSNGQDQGQSPVAGRPHSAQSYRASVSASPPTRDRPEDNITMRPRSESQRSSSHRSTPSDGDDRQRHARRSPPQDRNGSALFTLEGDKLVYEARPEISYDATERYVGEDGQLYDRGGNIRPRYAQSIESQSSQGQTVCTPRSPARSTTSPEEGFRQHEQPIFQDEESRVLARQSQEAFSEMLPRLPEHEMTEGQAVSERSYRGHDEGEQGEGQESSAEADRTISQLRRELLITRTALLQIQKGERLDMDHDEADLDLRDISRPHSVTMETSLDQGRGDMIYESGRASSSRAEVRYQTIPDEADMNTLRRKLDRTQEELELFRTSSNLSARDFVQASVN